MRGLDLLAQGGLVIGIALGVIIYIIDINLVVALLGWSALPPLRRHLNAGTDFLGLP